MARRRRAKVADACTHLPLPAPTLAQAGASQQPLCPWPSPLRCCRPRRRTHSGCKSCPQTLPRPAAPMLRLRVRTFVRRALRAQALRERLVGPHPAIGACGARWACVHACAREDAHAGCASAAGARAGVASRLFTVRTCQSQAQQLHRRLPRHARIATLLHPQRTCPAGARAARRACRAEARCRSGHIACASVRAPVRVSETTGRAHAAAGKGIVRRGATRGANGRQKETLHRPTGALQPT